MLAGAAWPLSAAIDRLRTSAPRLLGSRSIYTVSGMTDKSEKQKAAEGDVERLRQEGGPFVVAAEETRMPMVFMDGKASGQSDHLRQ